MSKAVDELDRLAASRLSSDGQRYTDVRRALVQVLREAEAPLTIPQIIERRRTLATSSVYRNLDLLERVQVVQRVVTNDEWVRFELAEDITGHHHHHLVCSGCGLVLDFELTSHFERSIDEHLGAVAEQHGFLSQLHRLDLVGLCRDCAVAPPSGPEVR
ncbi:MAG: Fe2+/Zn2+ uptake regulation protein [Acidimicrobiia bacterium]|nr:Fe2+/Zn2+ uptake regulation protein [Acidimicrobiia bacterium]